MTDYTHLLDRLTNATGADRELDVEIWLTVTDGSYRKKWNYTHSATGRVCEMDETRDKFGHLVLVPAYSESIDAAMSLVPEGYVIVSFTNGDLHPKYMDVREHSVWSVTLARKGFVVKEAADVLTFPSGKSSVPASAICIAAISALKAMASCEESSQ